ncbi:prevent-host-death protein [Rhodoferax lacus]|uniref:Prevent-host-death protein n=1 Tax=Rhodoferax lacus TaxID=2184758 RepID=A0A3E1RJZ6_9BURK|nr:YlcI/YnfO family protein [Rhodoferax lacus]RFO98890.1 prevent-host-death protein [Rhodoferax lacus]
MKTATLPTVRVLPEIRAEAEALLDAGESLSMFIEDSLRRHIALRQSERAFLARGMAAGARARETGVTISAEDSLVRLRALGKKRKASAKA